MNETAFVRARGLSKKYGKDEGLVRAVDDVCLDVTRGETLAVIGPSGWTMSHSAGRPPRSHGHS